MDFKEIRKEIENREKYLSKFACKSKDAIFMNENAEKNNEIRPVFFRDADRVIHSLTYTRYIDKTQVYSFVQNDHITHRVLHVQLVSKIARMIGKALNLNEDLIEAIALGHDVGHTPFGHKGEQFLDEICRMEKIGYFKHNAQSVRCLKDIEEINLSLQTLDGILAHNGELLQDKYEPINKTKEQFLQELNSSFEDEKFTKKIVPMTLEGCVVRICDIIAYIGRDIEDAIIVGSIKREDIPSEITDVLGNNNSKIVDTIAKDIIKNSIGKNYLCFTKDVFGALMKLKKWNSKNIYNSEEACRNQEVIQEYFIKLYQVYLKYLTPGNNEESESKNRLYEFINERSIEYRKNTSIKRMIIDYMAGQTDHYFLRECECNFKGFHKEELYKDKL